MMPTYDRPWVCTCPTPTPEPLPNFGASQCSTCKRALLLRVRAEHRTVA